MAWFVAALPVVPGKEGRAAKLKEELQAHWKRYEELNRNAELKRHMEFLQETPMGALVISIMEADDLSKISRAFDEGEYDKWWTARIHDVHGFDPRQMTDPPKTTPLLEWTPRG